MCVWCVCARARVCVCVLSARGVGAQLTALNGVRRALSHARTRANYRVHIVVGLRGHDRSGMIRARGAGRKLLREPHEVLGEVYTGLRAVAGPHLRPTAHVGADEHHGHLGGWWE